jgi:hypothetical protein
VPLAATLFLAVASPATTDQIKELHVETSKIQKTTSNMHMSVDSMCSHLSPTTSRRNRALYEHLAHADYSINRFLSAT